MEDPRQELLTLFEDIHKTYNLKESDYKAFVETLVKFNRKPRINVEGAKYVRIKFGQVRMKRHYKCCTSDDECECVPFYLSVKTFNNIYKVVGDEEVSDYDTFFNGEEGYKISKSLLDRVNHWFDKQHKHQLNPLAVVTFDELEVLE